MSMIHILHHQTDELIDFLTNDGDRLFWDDLHIQDISTYEERFEFTTPANIVSSGKINERSRILIPADGQGYKEFIVDDILTSMNGDKNVVAIPSYVDIEKQYIIEPGVYTGTIVEHLTMILPDTEWSQGYIEYSGIRTVEINDFIGAYSFLRRLATAFDSEIEFRVEISGNQISGRYIDFVQHIGDFTLKEIEIGKDLVDVEVQVNSERVVTSLFCAGPEREDGTRLTTIVDDNDAFKRWNRKGKKIYGIYSPESNNQDMTLAQLIQYGTTELKKRIASVVEYRVKAISIENLFPHETVKIGDSIRIINPQFVPPLYATARILRVERSIINNQTKTFEIGEVVTSNE